jgi:squalene monooxygenase
VTALDTDATGRVVGVAYRDGARRVLHARAPLTLACDGCASNLRRRVNPHAHVDVYSQFVGLVLDVSDVSLLPFPRHGHVILADPAPILFYPISSTQVRCLVDIPASVTGPHAAHMADVLAPQVPAALRPAFVAAVAAGGAKTMPNRVMADAPAVARGAVLLGDAFNMRHPLTGGGMTVALADVAHLRDALRGVGDLGDARAVAAALEQFYRRRRPLSSTINVLANALYSVFCASGDPARRDMRTACFAYLGAGGRRSGDPMGMLGGVVASPALLLWHFFGVALFGCGRALLPFPTPRRVGSAWALLRASFNIVKPLCDAERVFPLHLVPFSSIPWFR